MKLFKIVSIASSALFLYLFVQLLFIPDSFIGGVGLQSCETASILARRTSIFMLGISVLLFCSRNILSSKAQQYLCLSTGITMIGLACMGSYELMKGTVNSSMLQAIIIETLLGISFFIIIFINRRAKKIQ